MRFRNLYVKIKANQVSKKEQEKHDQKINQQDDPP